MEAEYDRVYVTTFNLRLKAPVLKLAWQRGKFHFLWRELSERGTTTPWDSFRAVSESMYAFPTSLLPVCPHETLNPQPSTLNCGVHNPICA